MKRAKKQRPPKNKKVRRKEKPVGPASRPAGQQAPHMQQAINQALAHHTAGRLPEAEAIYRQILQQDPNQYVALHLLGVIAYQRADNDLAVELITRAVAIKPDFAEAHFNLGNALHSLGRLDQAIASFQKAATIKPGYADAYVNLGNVLKESGRLQDAADSHRKALAIKPDLVEAHINLGSALQDLGQPDQAIASYRKGLAINPDFAEAHCNLGGALQDLGRLDEALTSYRQALAINPDFADAHYNLGIALGELGRIDDAFTSHRRAAALNPHNGVFWSGFAGSLKNLSFTDVDDTLLDDLLRLIDQPTVRPGNVVRPVISALRHSPDFPEIPAAEIDFADIAKRLSAMPLLLRIMALNPINDLDFERTLTALRAALLDKTMAAKTAKTDEKALPFAVALALHCFTNEYVFPETEAEKIRVEELDQYIGALVRDHQEIPAFCIAALGAYRPLYRFAWANQLAERQWAGAVDQVIKRQILEPMEERALGSRIPSLTPIHGEVSQAVRAQYEQNPYPRWIETGIRGRGRTIGAELRGAPLRFDLADYEDPESPEILLAGCGTGQQALASASRFANARVLAMDLSISSLSYAARKSAELGFSNIDYAQGDIMEMAGLGRQFDLIESIGVLHHLADPVAGWRVLSDILKPGGMMLIGLYSETARQDIVAGHSLIADKGYQGAADDICRCRQDIITLAEAGDEHMGSLCRRRDFFGLSECRDLLFHVQERRFTLPEIEIALQTLGLSFLGFEWQDAGPFNKFRKSHPDPSALISLPLWHDFEHDNPETFRGMYQFWCQKR